MTGYVIDGGRPLRGKVTAAGSKNAVLPMIAASMLFKGKIVLSNVPDIADVRLMCMIAESLGGRIGFGGGRLALEPGMDTFLPVGGLFGRARSSIYFLAPLLSKSNKITLQRPGGCVLGRRPIDMHLDILRALGAKVAEKAGGIGISHSGLTGAEIRLRYPSVGATVNGILLGLVADGRTSISNCAMEPEIDDLIGLLNGAGASVKRKGGRMTVDGMPASLRLKRYEVMPDRIEASTYLVAAAATGGAVEVKKADPAHMAAVLEALRDAGCELKAKKSKVSLYPSAIRPADVTAAPYPGFPTDMQPLITALLSKADGCSRITDNVFPNRFAHLAGLRRFGIRASRTEVSATITGSKLKPANVRCLDLRSGAAYAVAALAAEGRSELTRTEHVERGYEDFHGKLSGLGAKISRRPEATASSHAARWGPNGRRSSA